MATAMLMTPDGARLAYTHVAGPGPKLLFLHGWACRRSDWDAVIAGLDEYDAYTLDLPGHGDSPPHRMPSTMEAYGALLAQALTVIGLDDVVLLGHSMGGAVAVEAAIVAPERVARIIGVDTLTYASVYPRQSPAAIDATLAPLRADFSAGMLGLVDALTPTKNEALIHQVATEMADRDPGPSLELLRGLLDWDMAARGQLAVCPIDIVASRAMLTPEGRDGLPSGTRLHEVDLGGHFFLRERPDGTGRAIRQVLEVG